ncbi:hypothetical protein XI03_19785 [Bradyrhizobium sp. CCBAU 65884]|uniref:hypothetical protein n=1 Tax=Bradyrhizobium sp. CCBAU 65884 TaxID=722477 RepID=UPI003FA40889|nr:hypothetical protein [Bradyrhizobium sp. CCBAU 65884]
MSLTRIELLRVIAAGILPIPILGEEFGRGPASLSCSTDDTLESTELSGFGNQPETLSRRSPCLAMSAFFKSSINCAKAFALCFSHRLQNARLGDPAEAAVDGRFPAGLHHIEPDRARQYIGLIETRADTMGADVALIVAVGWFGER